MRIIAHRGYWLKQSEKNKAVAFERAVSCGFGIETDFRDYKGDIVISHDLPNENSIQIDAFFKLIFNCEANYNGVLAINVKSDGLQDQLRKYLNKYEIKNYFVFDMSIPDHLGYLKKEFICFSRESEFEPQAAFYEKIEGVWLDSFGEEWYSLDEIKNHLSHDKLVCIVSPELHNRDHLPLWNMIKEISHLNKLLLCTDFPVEAEEFFYGKN